MATKKAFKTCKGCPTPVKCKAGKVALVIMVGVGKPMKAKKK